MPRFVCAYDYLDETGQLVFRVCRWADPKGFSQKQPDGQGGWKRKRDRDGKLKLTMDGCRLVPYNLNLLSAAAAGLRDYGIVPLAVVVEGEKDADRLVRGGFMASCNAGGAGKWNPNFARYFVDFEVALIADNDAAGKRHMIDVARSVLPVAASTRMVDLGLTEAGQDFSDWADRGHTRGDLTTLIAAAPVLTLADLPPEPAVPKGPAARLPDRLSPYGRAALTKACEAIRTAADGVQSRTLNKETFSVAQLVAAGLLPEGQTFALLLDAAESMVSYDSRRPWRPVELRRIVTRSFGEGLRDPRAVPEPRDRRHG